MSEAVADGTWKRVVDPDRDPVNETPHVCALPPLGGVMHGTVWSCACGHSYRVNRRGDEAGWVSGSALNQQQVTEQRFEAPHACRPPSLLPSMPIGNGSSWQCAACGRSYRVNRRGEHLSWVSA